MATKYKLLKDLPDVKAGAIITKSSPQSHVCSYINNDGYTDYIDVDKVEGYPDFFAPYQFTTEDGIDIFKGDIVYGVDDVNIIFKFTAKYGQIDNANFKRFSTKKAAENYVKSLKQKEIKNRKFKLIKEFPFSPNLGEVVEFKTEKDFNDGITGVGSLPTLILEDCINFSEFWEEVKHCELINYPKSWKGLEVITGYCIINGKIEKLYCRDTDVEFKDLFYSESQIKSSLAFAQLSQLHKATIEEYNRLNNCNWEPDWTEIKHKYCIVRFGNHVSVTRSSLQYHTLAFPDWELAKFALDNWKDLWEQYYEIQK